MKITIIGGSGFVGSRLIEILHRDNEICNVDKQQSPFFNDITHKANVLDVASLEKEIPNDTDVVILLAAEHRDDVTPTSLYYDVNVGGMKNTLAVMEKKGIKRIVFTSSVAVYGLNKENPNETHEKDPFNHYGITKWQAEQVLQEWYKDHADWNINILRPTVIFGERNRGNVFNLLRQISGGTFLMVGGGNNKKSMAYVGNIVAFIKFLIEEKRDSYNVYNYIDKPDFTMNELVSLIGKVLNKHIPQIKVPYWIGMCGGYCFDLLAFVTRKKLPISSVRIKKFCATTEFDSSKMLSSGFTPQYSLGDGLSRTLKYEFTEHKERDEVIFYSE